ncbi:MAG: hypothetical protein ACQESW_12295, partial [Bacteroidota bacterium]
MLRKQMLFILVALFAASCTTMQQPTAHDELYTPQETGKTYATAGDQANRNQQVATSQQLVGEVESLLSENEQLDTTLIQNEQVSSNPYESILVDDMGDAFDRRRKGIGNPYYGMNSYSRIYNREAFWYASAYDPAFYTVVVMGDDVWVEPNYIAASFGYRNSIWGTPRYGNYHLGFYNSYYSPYSWNVDPYYSYHMGYMSGLYGGYGGYYRGYYPHMWYGDSYRNRTHGVQRRVSRDVFIGGSRQTALDTRPASVGTPERGIVVDRTGYNRSAITNVNDGRTVKRQDGSGERIYVRPQSENTRRAVSRATNRSTYRTSGTSGRSSIDRSRSVNRYQRPATNVKSIEVRRPDYVRERVNRSTYSNSRRSSVSNSSTKRSTGSSSSVNRNSSSSRSKGSSS